MEKQETDTMSSRPFVLSVFCVALFVYTASLTLLFLMATVFNGWVSNAVDDFFQDKEISRLNILILSALGFLLNGLSFYAVYVIWKLKRSGLYLFAISSVLFLLIPFFLGFGSVMSLLIISLVIISLFLFYSRLK